VRSLRTTTLTTVACGWSTDCGAFSSSLQWSVSGIPCRQPDLGQQRLVLRSNQLWRCSKNITGSSVSRKLRVHLRMHMERQDENNDLPCLSAVPSCFASASACSLCASLCSDLRPDSRPNSPTGAVGTGPQRPELSRSSLPQNSGAPKYNRSLGAATILVYLFGTRPFTYIKYTIGGRRCYGRRAIAARSKSPTCPKDNR
jgi:hypothetical protein